MDLLEFGLFKKSYFIVKKIERKKLEQFILSSRFFYSSGKRRAKSDKVVCVCVCVLSNSWAEIVGAPPNEACVLYFDVLPCVCTNSPPPISLKLMDIWHDICDKWNNSSLGEGDWKTSYDVRMLQQRWVNR